MITIDRRDLAFQLHDMLEVEAFASTERYADYDRSAMDGVLDTAERLAVDHFLPHAAHLDANEPKFVDGRVAMDPAVAEALAVYREPGSSAPDSTTPTAAPRCRRRFAAPSPSSSPPRISARPAIRS